MAADLRGYGDSSAPPEEPNSANYSFRAMEPIHSRTFTSTSGLYA